MGEMFLRILKKFPFFKSLSLTFLTPAVGMSLGRSSDRVSDRVLSAVLGFLMIPSPLPDVTEPSLTAPVLCVQGPFVPPWTAMFLHP